MQNYWAGVSRSKFNIVISSKKLEGNCDFLSNNNICARFYVAFLWRPTELLHF